MASAYEQVPVDEDIDGEDDDEYDIELSNLEGRSPFKDRPEDDNVLMIEEEEEEGKRRGVRFDDDDYNSNENDAFNDGLYEEEGGEDRIPAIIAQQEELRNSCTRWDDPWFFSTIITLLLLMPVLSFHIYNAWELTGRMWPSLIFSIHLFIILATTLWVIPTPTSDPKTCCRKFMAGLPIFFFDLPLFGFLYPLILNIIVDSFFIDADDKPVIEWSHMINTIQTLQIIGLSIVYLRITVGFISFVAQSIQLKYPEWKPTLCNFPCPCLCCLCQCCIPKQSTTILVRAKIRLFVKIFMYISLFIVIWGVLSAASHFSSFWPMPPQHHRDCDDLDTTECSLPFPSFHHMKPDSTTKTGWRVNFRSDILPPLRGGLQIHPDFLNKLDGFSTMAPILFYIKGMKESHESNEGSGTVELQGPESIEKSVTSSSATLLLDVSTNELVHHSAEIDYLDPKHPIVMVFPSKPLKHGTHYALAVVNAVDARGHRLPPTKGMKEMLNGQANTKHNRYMGRLIPSLQQAAPWFDYRKDKSSLQLMFDFVTISEESQLSNIRRVRDRVVSQVSSHDWNWKDHVSLVKIENGNCTDTSSTLADLKARTIHAEIDVPWFLSGFGRNGRAAILDQNAVDSGRSNTIGKAKFVAHIPCSVKQAAISNGQEGKPLRAVMEYGHGLFFSRQEADQNFLLRMANDNGYIVIAMDWRGMSVYDLPIVIKTLIGDPRYFEALRDNLIQGFANKLAMQQFSQSDMLSMDWFEFDSKSIPLHEKKEPASIFYGISQGGILGAGYTALSGATDLIDRGILGVPGTPFALVLTRSLEFVTYDQLMLMNFYNNRHVRILLSLVQMGWDTVEGAGLLAPPVMEPIPRLLLQAGLGDAVVPTIAAEALARALDASILPNNPRKIFGIPTAPAATDTTTSPTIDDKDNGPINNNNETYLGPHVTLTELLYEKEYSSLPLDDIPADINSVHVCVRLDRQLNNQIIEFINTGRIIDVCEFDGCRREKAPCG